MDLNNTITAGGPLTRTRVTNESYSGTASIAHTYPTAFFGGTRWVIDPLSNGETVAFSVAVKAPAGTGLTGGTLYWRDSVANTNLGTVSIAAPAEGSWVRVSGTYKLKPGERCDQVSVAFNANANATWYADAAQVNVGSSFPSYADGSTSGYHWSGAPNASATVKDSADVPWQPVTVLNQLAPSTAAYAVAEIGTAQLGDNNSSILVDDVQIEAGPTLSEWAPGGSIFHGYIEKWPVTTGGLTAEVDVTAVDGFSVLSNVDLRPPYQAQLLTTGPVGYWTLGDPVGSTELANLANDQRPAMLVPSKYGGATALLGADPIVRKDDSTCFSLANVATNEGTVVDICDGGKRRYSIGSDFSVAFWTRPVRPSQGTWVTLFASWADTADDLLSVRMDPSGRVEVVTTYTDGTVTTMTSTVVLSSSAPSFVAVTVGAGVTRLYVNGSSAGSVSRPAGNNDVRDMRWASLGGRQAGSIYAEYSNGRHAHLALWDRQISTAEVFALWGFGDDNGRDYVENEAFRIGRIATMANYQGEKAFDDGLSLLQGPSWSVGAGALEELQSAAEDASGYVFMDSYGRLTYHSRRRRQSAEVRFQLGDSLDLPYEPGLSFVMDEDTIINEVSYRRPNGAEGVVKNQASVDAYGRKSKSIELALDEDSAVIDAAYSMLNQYAAPLVRCDSVTLNCSATSALLPIALEVEIGDRITLSDLPSQAPESQADYYVEAIDTDVSAKGGTPEWVTTLSLSPAANTDVWVLEDPALGRLDRSTSLAL
ncbi:LamG-like jellyroll fold domain-containing protein [Streptomyces sp. NPDC056159]|uniref:LamG-like jellyroll fold domain-containing protein n=1 Tax=Streptomyces sp. NPDC056159 TaxID=3155537 RepID=UPI003442B510